MNGLIRSSCVPPPKFIFLNITGFLQKGDDLGRFRQLDEILFIDGYPGYMQLMSVVENCMLVVSEVKGDHILVLSIYNLI